MKKVRIAMSMLAASMMLSGCGQGSSVQEQHQEKQNETVQLTVWGGRNEQEILNEMADSFKEEYAGQASFEITVEIEDEGTCKDRILSDVASAPDVFTFIDDQLSELAAAGVIEPMEAEEIIRESNAEGSVEAASINGQLYAYPMTADNGYVMFYNKKYFAPQQVQSLDEMLKVASSHQKKIAMDWTSGWYLYSFFGNTGLKLELNPDGITNFCDWNSKTGAIKGTDIGSAMLAIANNPGFISTGDDGLKAGAKDDTIIAGVSGVWCVSALKEAWGNDFAAVKLPTYKCAGKDVQLASFAGYKMIGVNSYSENKEWAEKLAEWLTNEENQKLRFIKRGMGPSNKNAAAAEEVKNSPAIQALIQQSEFASLQRVGPKYWDAVSAYGQALVSGSASTSNMQAAMDDMVKKITVKITD